MYGVGVPRGVDESCGRCGNGWLVGWLIVKSEVVYLVRADLWFLRSRWGLGSGCFSVSGDKLKHKILPTIHCGLADCRHIGRYISL